MTYEKNIFINIADNFGKVRNPRLNFRLRWFWHSRNLNLKTFLFKLFFQPRKPTLIGMAIPAVDYENFFVHKPLRIKPILFMATKPYPHAIGDRKSTRLNSSHMSISYAVFCLKKK